MSGGPSSSRAIAESALRGAFAEYRSVPEIVADGRTGLLADTLDELVDAIERVERIDRMACRRHVEARFTVQRRGATARRGRSSASMPPSPPCRASARAGENT